MERQGVVAHSKGILTRALSDSHPRITMRKMIVMSVMPVNDDANDDYDCQIQPRQRPGGLLTGLNLTSKHHLWRRQPSLILQYFSLLLGHPADDNMCPEFLHLCLQLLLCVFLFCMF